MLASLRNRLGFTYGTKAACVAVATLAMASAARADFTVNYTVELHTPDANHARFNFYTLNDGNHGSGTTLLADDIELISDQPMVIGTRPDNGQPDISGVGAPDPYHSDRSFVNVLGDPSMKGYNEPKKFSIVFSNPKLTDAAAYANGTTDFREVGGWINEPADITQTTNGPVATAAANGGRGALLASAVVPMTATYVKMIPWGLGGDSGPAFGDFIDPANPPPQIGHLAPDGYNELSPLFASVPEPASMTVLAAGMLLCTSRRRRLPPGV